MGEWGDGVVNPVSSPPPPRPTHLCSPGHMLLYWEEGHSNNADVLSRSFQRRSKSAGDTYISVSDVTLQPFNGVVMKAWICKLFNIK